jgi:PAS domain S-box-containing protein
MATQNLKRKKNNNLKDQKRTRSLNNSAIIKPLSAKQMGKRAEEALQEIEERFRLAFENANIGMCLVDLQGRLTKVNHQMCEIFGYSQEELEGMTVNDIAHPEDLNISTTFIQRATSGKIEYTHFEKRYLHKDGHIVWGAVSSSLVRDPQGVPQYFISHVQDITERKRAEEALRQSEEKYRTILENIEDGYFEADIAGNFTFFNNSVCRMLGYSKDEMMGMNNRQYTDKGNAKKLYQAFNKVYRTGEPTKGFDWEIIRKDGTKRYIETSVSLIKNISGQPIGFRGIVRDITERKQAEEGLKDSEERYRKLFENAIDGIVLADLERGIIIDCNKVIGGLVEREKTELIGQSQQILHPPEDSIGEVSRTFVQHRFDKEGQVLETQVITKTGERKRVEIKANILELKGRKVLQGIFRDITERKQAEKKLRESEEKYRTILENIEEGYYEVDIAGNFTFFNDSLCQMLGYIKDELMGMNNRQYTDQENAKKLYQAFNKVYKTGEPEKGFDWEVIRKDGTIRFVEASVSLIKDYRGQPIGFRGIVRDIAEHKQAEEVLRESEGRLKTILDSIQTGVLIIDPVTHVIVDVNPTAIKLIGAPKEKIVNSICQKYICPAEIGKCPITDLKQNVDNSERILLTVNGETRPIIKTVVPMMLGGRKYLLESFIDITERKRAEEALRESESRFQKLFDDAPVGYHEYNTEGLITQVNRTELEMLGYTAEEMLGQPVWQFITEIGKSRETVIAKLSGEIPPDRQFERSFQRKDGTTFPALIEDRFLRDSQGKIAGVRSTIQDITERKRAEEEMVSLQEQFRQSQKMEAVGRLGGGIAHDFNNLLTIIKGYSQLSLLDLKESDPLWGNIQEIQKATQRATDLTRQLLAFSRRQILDLKVLDLNTLLKDLDKMLRRIIGEDIDLVTLLAEDLGRVKVDPGQMEQMVMNLAVNARDAMPKGGKLTVETCNVELDEAYARKHVAVTPGRYVMLSISDAGAGMTPEVRERIFEPFFTTKEKGKGTGLGLSTVYGIAKQSGGNIWVYSEPGHGTTFKIYLPRVEEELDNLHVRDETESLPRGSETVFLVEDEPSVRSLAYRVLCQQGYTVLEAANGEEALRVAQEHAGEKIHLLLTDVVMPQMGGRELAETLKLLRPDIKVLYTSGYTDNAIVHHGVLNPGTHFLQKPFSPKTLSHKVREVLDR